MRQSQLFTKTRREAPSDEVAKNAQLLVRAGFIHKEMAGVYSYLPLGLRVVEKIVRIVKDEMDAIGGVQMKTSALQNKAVWETTGRWSDDVVDAWFKTTLKNGSEVGLSFTNEEAYSNLVKNFISSYKDLPIYPYDFKTIFRNETRSKSGIMRGREFYWKALYSFSTDKVQHDEFYEKAKAAYLRIYERVGLKDSTYLTFASGGTFSKFSHEFQTVSDAGEDEIYIDEAKGIAINKEVLTDEVLAELEVKRDALVQKKGIEVGNIFSLGSKFSEPFGLTYKNADGENVPVFMGSYGIGITRLMGVIVEKLADEKGMVWPEAVAPFIAHIVLLTPQDETAKAYADTLYEDLAKAGVEVLYDDRDMRAGEKLADSDLIGIPARIVIGKQTVETGKVESTYRKTGETKLVGRDELIGYLTGASARHHG